MDQHWWPALRARAAARPRTADVTVAAVVYLALTLGVSTAAKVAGPWWLAPLCNLAPALPLVWRRVAPLPALAASLGGGLVVIATVGPTGGEPAAMFALATAVSREPSARRAAAAAALVAVAILAVVAFAAPEDSVAALVNGVSAWLVAGAAGLAGRARRAELAAVADRGAREAELAVAAERTRLARDVHDVVSHNVAVMVALSAGVEQTAERDPAAARVAAGQAATVGREALQELRGLLGVLAEPAPPTSTPAGGDGWPGAAPTGGGLPGAGPRDGGAPPVTVSTGSGPPPPVAASTGAVRPASVSAAAGPRAPQPGLDDLATLADRARLAGLDAELQVEVDGVPELVQLTVFRIAQEAVTNVLRHAEGATRVRIDVRRDGAAVRLDVSDDGALSVGGTDMRAVATEPAVAVGRDRAEGAEARGPRSGDDRAAGAAGRDRRAGEDGRDGVDRATGRRAATPSAAHPPAAGRGLVGMRERVALHGGAVEAGPRPEGGWRVTARVPR